MGVREDHLDPGQAASFQRAQEVGPEWFGLGIADIEAQHLAASVGSDTDGDRDRLGHHPAADSGFAVGRIDKHIRIGDAIQRATGEGGDILIQVGADP